VTFAASGPGSPPAWQEPRGVPPPGEHVDPMKALTPRRPVGSRMVRILRTPMARWIAWIVVAIIFGSFVPRTYVLTTRPEGNDLGVYLESNRALVRGENPYAYSIAGAPQNHGPYPLTIDALILPFTGIPLWLAETIWFGLSLAAFLGALAVLDQSWQRATADAGVTPEIPFAVRVAMVTLVLFVPLQSHFGYGQLDLIILLTCCLFVRALLDHRRGGAAFWLGSGIALKLTPAVFLVDLAARRKVRLLLLTALWILVGAVLVPSLVSVQTLAFYRGAWLEGLRRHLESPVEIDWRTRFSLAGMLVRLWPPLLRVPGLHYWVATLVLAPLAALGRPAARAARAQLLLFAAYLTAIPLLSPISEMHHLTMLLGALWVWLLAAGAPPRMLAFDGAAAALFVTLHWLGNAWSRTRPALGHYAATRGSPFDSGAILVLYLVLLVRAWLGCRASEDAR